MLDMEYTRRTEWSDGLYVRCAVFLDLDPARYQLVFASGGNRLYRVV